MMFASDIRWMDSITAEQMLCVYFMVFCVLASLIAITLSRSPVKSIAAADAEDREMGLFCEPETLWSIMCDIQQESLAKPVNHWQLDACIKALHKGGYVLMGPSKDDLILSAEASSIGSNGCL